MKADKFIIFDVQEYELRPKMCFLSRLKDLRNIDTRYKQFQVFHYCRTPLVRERSETYKLTSRGLVFAEQDRKFSENTHVCSFQAKTGFKKIDDLLKVTAPFIYLYQIRQFLL